MTTTTQPVSDVDRVTREAMDLDPTDRIDLAIALWQSVHGSGEEQETEEDRQATLALLDERIRQIDSGEVECIPGEEFKRQVLERLGR